MALPNQFETSVEPLAEGFDDNGRSRRLRHINGRGRPLTFNCCGAGLSPTASASIHAQMVQLSVKKNILYVRDSTIRLGHSGFWFCRLMAYLVRHLRRRGLLVLSYVEDLQISPSPYGKRTTHTDCLRDLARIGEVLRSLRVRRRKNK